MTERARPGSVDVPNVGSIPAIVDLDADHATALLLVRPLLAVDEVVGARVGIEVTTSRGLLKLDAHVAAMRDGEVLELDVAGDGELVQRRNYARVDALLQVTFAGSAGERVSAAALNISGSGAIVSHLGGLELGDCVELSLRLAAHEPPIVIGGRVMRASGDDEDERRAIHFEQVHEVDRERIVRYVFARQRLELQRVRDA